MYIDCIKIKIKKKKYIEQKVWVDLDARYFTLLFIFYSLYENAEKRTLY